MPLDPESAKSCSAGFVWSPAILTNTALAECVDFEFTYFNHSVTGDINGFATQLVNSGQMDSDGFDFDVFWACPETGPLAFQRRSIDAGAVTNRSPGGDGTRANRR